jgi:hypothetical protein
MIEAVDPSRRARIASALGVLLAIVILLSGRSAGAQPATCSGENLLARARIVAAKGVEHPELVNDGWLAGEGYPWKIGEAAVMTGLHPYIDWDLGEDTPIRAAAVQADANDIYRISVSPDRQHWTTLWNVEQSTAGGGLRERVNNGLDGVARYVRFEALRGDDLYSAAEVRLYCSTPAKWPPPSLTHHTLVPPPGLVRTQLIYSWKVVLALVGIAALIWLYPQRTTRRWKLAVLLPIFASCAFAWTQFGDFNSGDLLHSPDAFHYFMGPKYFDETGYFDLYRCTAKAEHELGRGNLFDSVLVRDLDDNRIYPGWWIHTDAARCRAHFTPERWESFKRDVDAFHGMTAKQIPLHETLADHGFNATPFHTAFLRLWTFAVQASQTSISWLSQMDSVALLIALGALYWGFGGWTAAGAALMIAIGFHWAYHWVGGCIARHIWFMWACIGLSLLNRKKPFWGAAALTLAGLHRFFPFVFVGGVGLAVLIRAAMARKLDRTGRHVLAGFAITLAIGGVIGGTVNGWASYRDHARVLARHTNTPGANRMGLPAMMAWAPGRYAHSMADARLSDPHEVWKAEIRLAEHERRPIQLLAIALSLALVAWAAFKGARLWECAVLTGPLLFSLGDMTSYDYIWAILFVPLAISRPKRIAWLVGYALYTLLLGAYLYDQEDQHLLYDPPFLLLLVALSVSFVRELRARPPEPAPVPAQLGT